MMDDEFKDSVREGMRRARATASSVVRRAAAVLRALEAHNESIQLPGWKVLLQQLQDEELDETNGGMFLAAVQEEPGALEELKVTGVAMLAAASYAIQSVKVFRAGDEAMAWSLAFDAAQWEGWLSGYISFGDPAKAQAEILTRIREGAARGGKKGADARKRVALDPAKVVAAAKKLGWPAVTKDIYKRVASKISGASQARVGKILRAHQEKNET